MPWFFISSAGAGTAVFIAKNEIVDIAFKIINKEYNDNIIYKFYLNKEQLNFIPELEKIAIHVSIKDKVLIEND